MTLPLGLDALLAAAPGSSAASADKPKPVARSDAFSEIFKRILGSSRHEETKGTSPEPIDILEAAKEAGGKKDSKAVGMALQYAMAPFSTLILGTDQDPATPKTCFQKPANPIYDFWIPRIDWGRVEHEGVSYMYEPPFPKYGWEVAHTGLPPAPWLAQYRDKPEYQVGIPAGTPGTVTAATYPDSVLPKDPTKNLPTARPC